MSLSVCLVSASLCVCVSVRERISETALPIFARFSLHVIVTFLGSSLATLRYVMYFRFHVWRHLCAQWPEISDAKRTMLKVTQQWLNRGSTDLTSFDIAANTQTKPIALFSLLVCLFVILVNNKSLFSLILRLSTGHCPHLLLSAVACCRSCLRGAQQQTRGTPLPQSIDGTDRQTDGLTLGRFIDRAPRTTRAMSINALPVYTPG